MNEDLITALIRVPSIKVVSRLFHGRHRYTTEIEGPRTFGRSYMFGSCLREVSEERPRVFASSRISELGLTERTYKSAEACLL